MKKILTSLSYWRPVGVAIILLGGLSYAAIQQVYRTSLNDPQIQIAEDIVSGLQDGKPLGQFAQQTDLDKNLSPYVIVYNDKHEAISHSGTLGGVVPVPPAGVFDYALKHGQDRITWEPKPGIRSAIVVMPYKHDPDAGFVLVGRSMREVEKRENNLAKMVSLGIAITLVLSFLTAVAGDMWRHRSTVKVEHEDKKEDEVDTEEQESLL